MDETLNAPSSRRPLGLHPQLLGCAALVFSFAVSIQDVNPLRRSPVATQNLHAVLPYILLGIAFAGALVNLLARWEHPVPKGPVGTGLGPMSVVVVTILLVSSLVFLHQFVPTDAAMSPYRELAGLFAGFAAAWLSARWVDVFSRYDGVELMGNLAFCGCIGIPAYVLTTLVPTHTTQTVMLAAAALASGVLLIIAQDLRPTEGPIAGEATSPRIGADDGRFVVRRTVALLWRPLAGTLFCIYMAGLIWDPIVSSFSTAQLEQWSWGVLIGPLVVFAGALAVASSFHSRHIASLAISLPIAAAILLMLPLFELYDSTMLDIVWDALREGCFAFFFLTSAIAVAEATHATGGRGVTGVVLVLAAAAFLVGDLVVESVGTGARSVSIVLLTIYLVALCWGMAMQMGRAPALPPAPRGRALPEALLASLSRRCDELAHISHLSPREAEVLVLLAGGHTQAFVADQLQISRNTVHTHTKNIYAKMGVDSREDLLSLVESDTSGSTSSSPDVIGQSPNRPT